MAGGTRTGASALTTSCRGPPACSCTWTRPNGGKEVGGGRRGSAARVELGGVLSTRQGTSTTRPRAAAACGSATPAQCSCHGGVHADWPRTCEPQRSGRLLAAPAEHAHTVRSCGGAAARRSTPAATRGPCLPRDRAAPQALPASHTPRPATAPVSLPPQCLGPILRPGPPGARLSTRLLLRCRAAPRHAHATACSTSQQLRRRVRSRLRGAATCHHHRAPPFPPPRPAHRDMLCAVPSAV